MKRCIWIFAFSLILILLLSVSLIAEEIILLNPNMIEINPQEPYSLLSSRLHLPEIESESLEMVNEDALKSYIALYIDRNYNDNVTNLRDSIFDNGNFYDIDINEDENIITLNPLPGMLFQADYNRQEEDYRSEEDAIISLQYWLNNRTLIRAEHGIERVEWWDIREITLETDEEIHNPTEQQLIFNEEKSESSRLGIAYQGNDRLTFSADFINDMATFDTDFSTFITIQYKDKSGLIRYINQNDFGDIRAHINSIELGYKDLATLNASYRIINPQRIEEQLHESQSIWDFGLGLNLNEISSLSFGYQVKGGVPVNIDTEEEEKEANINARFEIKF